eukprot:TRINITY_DN99197_c0_g1_i1.p1 TRINITY_DN99197_c0_g1~~TRINITY_DN99197_c0_g1_i1.p1  ORF type:complete len:379 (+),score=62.73 TRINITY_DN99197_c0_g1_i1:57-1193(+)
MSLSCLRIIRCLALLVLETSTTVVERSSCSSGASDDIVSALQLQAKTPCKFEVQTVDLGQNISLKVLRNKVSGEQADIVWTYGGKIDSLILKSASTGKLQETLIGSNRNASEILKTSWVNGLLIPYANRIANDGRYTLNGRAYHLSSHIHGLLLGQPMVVLLESSGGSASVTLGWGLSSKEAEKHGYPGPLSVQISYILNEDGFTIRTKVENPAEAGGPLPFYMGWHPYFKVSDVSRSKVILDNCTKWNHITLDDEMIPTGFTEPFNAFNGLEAIGGSYEKPTPWDDGLKMTGLPAACRDRTETQIVDPNGSTTVLWQGTPAFQWMQVYTGGVEAGIGQSIAVEPMSAQTDAYNNFQGTELFLQAGEAWEGAFGVRLL